MDEIKWKLDKSKSWTDLHNFIKPGRNIDIEAEVGVNDLHGSLNVGHFRYGNKYGTRGRSQQSWQTAAITSCPPAVTGVTTQLSARSWLWRWLSKASYPPLVFNLWQLCWIIPSNFTVRSHYKGTMGQGTGLELMKFMFRVSQVFGPEPADSSQPGHSAGHFRISRKLTPVTFNIPIIVKSFILF